MKTFDQKHRLGQWQDRHSPWRPWFAWRPVRLGKHGRITWLRRINRRFVTYLEADLFCAVEAIKWEYKS